MHIHPVAMDLRKQVVDPASLYADADLFETIAADLRENAKFHAPAPVWEAAGGGAFSTATEYAAPKLLQPWLGFGAQPVTPEVLGWYYPYLKQIDRFGLVDRYFAGAETILPEGEHLIVADLGSIIDVNLAARHLDTTRPFKVVEIGGGYGRLAEAFCNLFPGLVTWVLIDAVPSSMIYAAEYLRKACPGIRVASHYDGAHPRDADCYILPSWRLEEIDGMTFDLAINVQSMQEMDQHHVDFYLNWLDGALKPGALAYLVNRRDHVFRGDWNYPARWECMEQTTTPRSFLRDMPAEIYRKQSGDYRVANASIAAGYRRQQAIMRQGAIDRAARTGAVAY